EMRAIATQWNVPVSTSVQFAPASEDLSTPSPTAYTVLGVAGSMATALRIRSDVSDQLAPASVLRKTPPLSPTFAVAYTLAGAAGSIAIPVMAANMTSGLSVPVGLQVSPPSRLLKNPPPSVPA